MPGFRAGNSPRVAFCVWGYVGVTPRDSLAAKRAATSRKRTIRVVSRVDTCPAPEFISPRTNVATTRRVRSAETAMDRGFCYAPHRQRYSGRVGAGACRGTL